VGNKQDKKLDIRPSFLFRVTNNSSPSLGIFATSSSLMTERARRPGSLFSVVRKHCSASQKLKRLEPVRTGSSGRAVQSFWAHAFVPEVGIGHSRLIFCFWFDKLTIAKYLTPLTSTRPGRFADSVGARFDSHSNTKILKPKCIHIWVKVFYVPEVGIEPYRFSTPIVPNLFLYK